MLLLGVLDETRKKVEQKREYFHFEIQIIDGIQKIKDQKYGIYIMEEKIKGRVFVYFRSQIGQN